MRINRFIGVFVCIVLCQLSVMDAGAQVTPGRLTFSPFIGGYMFEGNQDIDDDLTYGAAIGYYFTKNWAAEVALNIVNTEYDDKPQDLDLYSGHIDILYHFMPSEKLVPFVALGAGYFNYRRDPSDNETNFAANYGAGLKYFLTENTALRCDVRHFWTNDGGDTFNNLCYTVGFTFHTPKPKTAAAPPPPPAPAPAPPMDSDGDGVPDTNDKCPDTPKGVQVDSVGCPLDGDGDGVPDYKDKCPRTIKGATVNEFGCWVCKDVNFDFNKWEIKPEYGPYLDKQIDIILKNWDFISASTVGLEIQGHTDSIGSLEYNQGLSEKRANAVRDYFIKKGIDAKRLVAKGYGETMPLATNDTEEGRAVNRRVQFNVCYDLVVE